MMPGFKRDVTNIMRAVLNKNPNRQLNQVDSESEIDRII